jgi:hypothetical protein
MMGVMMMAEKIREDDPQEKDARLSESELENLRKAIRMMYQICKENNLPTSSILLESRIESPPETSGELRILREAVLAELRGRLFLGVPENKAQFYEPSDLISEKARLAFPTAHAEIVEASNCYALGRNTASVFHSMRAAEIGLWALSAELNVSFPNYPIEMAQWFNLIEQVESRIRSKQSATKGVEKDEALTFYSDAAVHFLCFKDAWRSRVAHARATFGEERSLSILNHTREFFEVLGQRLAEDRG